MANIKGKQLASNLSVTNVTASGHISASNTSTGSFGLLQGDGSELTGITSGIFQPTGSVQATTNDIEITGSLSTLGDLKVSQYIKHIGDETTFINFTSDRIRFKAGNIGFLDLEKDASTPYPATINPGGNRINFRVMDRNTDLLLKTDSEAFNVGLFFAGSRKLETTSAGIDVSNVNVTASGHITASGNISSSATITSENSIVKNDLTVGGNLDIADTIFHTGDSNTKIRFPDVDTISFHTSGLERLRITSGGKISGSAVSTGSFGQLEIGNGGDIVLTEDQRIFFEADKATYIESHAADSFRVVVNDRQMLLLDEDTGNRAVFGNGTKVFIGEDNNFTPLASLHIAGNLWVSGSDAQGGAHITASGNISASGDITANEFNGIFIGALSSSAQIASNISGSFTAASSSFSTRITTEEGNVDTLQARDLIAGAGLTGGGTLASDRTFAVGQGTGITVNANDVAIGQDVATTADVTFATITTTGNIESQGDVIAQNYIVSSSVTHMTSSFRSGSTISGDTPSDDTHQFTGSLFITGSAPTDITTTHSIFVGNDITASANISASGQVIASGTGSFGSIETTGDINVAGRLAHTGDADTRILFTDDDVNITVGGVNMVDFTQDTVSETTFNEAGADVDLRIESAGDNKAVFIDASKNSIRFGSSANTHVTASGNISSSASIIGRDFSGIFIGALSSSAQIASNISGSFTAASSSFSTRVTNAESELSNTLISSSAQIASNISGSFTTPSASFSTRITTAESELSNTLISSSAQIASNISGSFTAASSSFSTRITTAESELSNTLISSSAQIASDISGSLSTTSLNALGLTLVSSSAQIANNISGSFTTLSASLSGRIVAAEAGEITAVNSGTGLSGGGTSGALTLNVDFTDSTLKSNISGSFTAASSSFSTRITTAESELSNTLVSSSAQIASNISGSFTAASSSFSTRITTAESELSNTLFSSSAQIDHDSTTNFVANEHIDHSAVSITAGDGLTGGGTIASNRTLAVGEGTGVTVNANDVAIGQDVATNANVTFASITTTGNIEAEGDVIAQNYIVSSSVTHMTSSFRSGSTISGDTPADDTHQFTGSLFITGSAPTDITTTNSIFVGNDITGSVISGSSLLGVVGTATQGTINHDSLAGFVANEHIDHSGVTLTAGDGLSGGGDITTNRSFAVEAAQTTITSIINSSLGKIGTAADQEYITFGTSNEVNTFVNNSERLSVTNTGVDITGNLDTSATGSFGHISSTGVIRTTSIISGSTLESTGDLTLDSSGNINLDADGAVIKLKDGGTEFGRLSRVSSDLVIKSSGNNNDMLFKGQDGGATITALQLDMSEGGNAQFLGNISGSQIEASGDVIAFGSSDKRLKDNIQPIQSPLEKMDKIGGYTFDWNDKQDAYQGHDVGVIAQEIEEVLPEVVMTRGTGYKAVKYEKIVPLLIESIKELQKKVEDIEKNCDCLNK